MPSSTIPKGFALVVMSLGPLTLAMPAGLEKSIINPNATADIVPVVNSTRYINTNITLNTNVTPTIETSDFDLNACKGIGCAECRNCHASCLRFPWMFRWLCDISCKAICKLSTGKENPQASALKRDITDGLRESFHTQAGSSRTDANTTAAIRAAINNTTSSGAVTVTVEPSDFDTTSACTNFPINCHNLVLPLLIEGCEAAHRLVCMKEIPIPIPGLRKRPPPPPQPSKSSLPLRRTEPCADLFKLCREVTLDPSGAGCAGLEELCAKSAVATVSNEEEGLASVDGDADEEDDDGQTELTPKQLRQIYECLVRVQEWYEKFGHAAEKTEEDTL